MTDWCDSRVSKANHGLSTVFGLLKYGDASTKSLRGMLKFSVLICSGGNFSRKTLFGGNNAEKTSQFSVTERRNSVLVNASRLKTESTDQHEASIKKSESCDCSILFTFACHFVKNVYLSSASDCCTLQWLTLLSARNSEICFALSSLKSSFWGFETILS